MTANTSYNRWVAPIVTAWGWELWKIESDTMKGNVNPYQPPKGTCNHSALGFACRMRIWLGFISTMFFSFALGLLWNLSALVQMRERIDIHGWWFEGGFAGVCAGCFTLKTSHAKGLFDFLCAWVTLYIAIAFYCVFIHLLQVGFSNDVNAWRFDLVDRFRLCLMLSIFSTVPFGFLNIPLIYLTRRVVIAFHKRMMRIYGCERQP
jgi:hypothetical protein